MSEAHRAPVRWPGQQQGLNDHTMGMILGAPGPGTAGARGAAEPATASPLSLIASDQAFGKGLDEAMKNGAGGGKSARRTGAASPTTEGREQDFRGTLGDTVNKQQLIFSRLLAPPARRERDYSRRGCRSRGFDVSVPPFLRPEPSRPNS